MTDLEKKLEQLCVGQGVILFPKQGGWVAVRLDLEDENEIMRLVIFNTLGKEIEATITQAETLGALVGLLK
jgi:hypothetical protein